MNPIIDRRLGDVVAATATPAYAYFADVMEQQVERLKAAFPARISLSYAIKANPNVAVLRQLRRLIPRVDASSIGEIERALLAGYDAGQVSFSGPGKRRFELERAVYVGCGDFVCESEHELETLNSIAAHCGRRVNVLVRINLRRLPAKFGARMGGLASQFGIDEERMDGVLGRFVEWRSLDLMGFHVYSGSNSLTPEAIAENMANAFETFERLSCSHGFRPIRLIVGAGFGIPYTAEQAPLDLDRVAALVNPVLDRVAASPRLAGAERVFELGRFVVGPSGYLLTSVVDLKTSRDTSIAICDAGFNNHLAAFGLMGSLIRRNWPIVKVTPPRSERKARYTLVGPLCTSIDTLATDIELPVLERGDVLAVASSGAYGLTASPTRFISHPEPREAMVSEGPDGIRIVDISERYPVPPFADRAVAAGAGWHV